MRLNEGVEWGAHCVVLLAALPPDVALSASRLAEYHGVPAAYLSKTLQQLSRAGIVTSVPGRYGGYRLARPADEITMLDVVLAVDGEDHAFRCTEIRRRGPARLSRRASPMSCRIAATMWAAERAYRASLAEVTIATIAEGVAASAPPASVERVQRWLVDALTR